jgi:hypothetical protein
LLFEPQPMNEVKRKEFQCIEKLREEVVQQKVTVIREEKQPEILVKPVIKSNDQANGTRSPLVSIISKPQKQEMAANDKSETQQAEVEVSRPR